MRLKSGNKDNSKYKLGGLLLSPVLRTLMSKVPVELTFTDLRVYCTAVMATLLTIQKQSRVVNTLLVMIGLKFWLLIDCFHCRANLWNFDLITK